MSLRPETMTALMAYADGELDGQERRAIEDLLSTDEEAANLVDNIRRLHDYVELGVDARTASFDIVDSVMARIDAAEPEASSVAGPKGAPVVALDAARARRAPGGVRGVTIGLGIAAALAVAAAAVMFIRPKEGPVAMAPVPSSATPLEEVPGGVEVTAVDAPGQSVSVFYLPSASDVSTSVVVWIDETGGK